MSFGTSNTALRVSRVECLCANTAGSSADAQRGKPGRAASWSSEDISFGVSDPRRMPRLEWQRARSSSWVELGKYEGTVVILDWLGRMGRRSAGRGKSWRARLSAGCRNVGAVAVAGLKCLECLDQPFLYFVP